MLLSEEPRLPLLDMRNVIVVTAQVLTERPHQHCRAHDTMRFPSVSPSVARDILHHLLVHVHGA